MIRILFSVFQIGKFVWIFPFFGNLLQKYRNKKKMQTINFTKKLLERNFEEFHVGKFENTFICYRFQFIWKKNMVKANFQIIYHMYWLCYVILEQLKKRYKIITINILRDWIKCPNRWRLKYQTIIIKSWLIIQNHIQIYLNSFKIASKKKE